MSEPLRPGKKGPVQRLANWFRKRLKSTGRSAESEMFPTMAPVKRLLEAYENPAPPPVLVLGDSVMERVSWHDTDTRTLGRMIADACQPVRVCVAARRSYHPVLFQALLDLLARLPGRPAQIVLPVNLRCFSPQWNLNPIWQFGEELRRIQGLPSDRAAAFSPLKALAPEDLPGPWAEFHALPLDMPGLDSRNMGEFYRLSKKQRIEGEEGRPRTAELFRVHYQYSLDDSHRQLRALAGIRDAAAALGSRLLVYLTPVNHRSGTLHAGAPWEQTLLSHAAKVRQIFEGHQGVDFHDWSRRFGPEAFFHANDPTEHLAEAARKDLSSSLAALLRGTLNPS